jgi:hypothetical protein
LASGRFAAAFTARARVGDAGPSFCPAAHASSDLLALLRDRGHPRRPGTHTHKRIAVVGSGIAGLSAAWALSGRAHVTLFEAAAQAGGHTHTVDVTLDGPAGPVTQGVDTGFLVFNERTYPLLIQLLGQLGIATARSDMSFSAQVARDAIEWSGSSLSTVFAQRRNLLRPAFWGMLADLLRFNRLCTALAAQGEEAALAEPIGAFLERHGFGRAFREWYLLPMVACIWSCPTAQMLSFPVRTLIRFCHNHGLLQVNDRPQWWTVAGGARHYVDAMLPAIHELRRLPAAASWCRARAAASISTPSSWPATATRAWRCSPRPPMPSSSCSAPSATSPTWRCCTPTPRCCHAAARPGRRGTTRAAATVPARYACTTCSTGCNRCPGSNRSSCR